MTTNWTRWLEMTKDKIQWLIKHQYPTEEIPYHSDYYRKPVFNFGTEIVIADNFHYKVEYLSNEKSLGYSRMLWVRSNYDGGFYELDEDPIVEDRELDRVVH